MFLVKNAFWWENKFLAGKYVFSEKMCFYVLAVKCVFVGLTDKRVFGQKCVLRF